MLYEPVMSEVMVFVSSVTSNKFWLPKFAFTVRVRSMKGIF